MEKIATYNNGTPIGKYTKAIKPHAFCRLSYTA